MRNGSDFSPDGYHYHAYGEAQKKVEEWIRNFPEETDFNYNTIAEECDIQAPTVSSIVLKMARADPPALARGNIAGEYRRITGVEPVIHTRRRGEVRGAGRKPVQETPKPGNGPVGDLLEVIGVMKNGAVMLRSEDGRLWKAEELEL